MNSDYLNNYSTLTNNTPKHCPEPSRQYKSLVVETPNRHRPQFFVPRPYTTGVLKSKINSRNDSVASSDRSYKTLSIDQHFDQTFKGNNSEFFRSRFVQYIHRRKQRGLKELVRKYAENPQNNTSPLKFKTFKSLDLINQHDKQAIFAKLQNRTVQTNLLQSYPILTNATQKVFRLLQLKTQKQASFEQIKDMITSHRQAKVKLFRRRLQVKHMKDQQWNIEWMDDHDKERKRYLKRLVELSRQNDRNKQRSTKIQFGK